MFSFPAVKAKIVWPRKVSKGLAIVKCYVHDVDFMICDFSNLEIGGRYVRCSAGRCVDSIVVSGFSKELSEADILRALRSATNRRILDFFIVRGDAVENPPLGACEKALLREISPFMPKRNPQTSCCRVQVFPPELKDAFMKAFITFDGRLHLEAARALEHMEGKVLPGCHSWQKIKCEQMFHSLISCSASIYVAIKKQLDSLLASFSRVKGTFSGLTFLLLHFVKFCYLFCDCSHETLTVYFPKFSLFPFSFQKVFFIGAALQDGIFYSFFLFFSRCGCIIYFTIIAI
jgi:ATP-dependent RNA helicase DHX8/PRP22